MAARIDEVRAAVVARLQAGWPVPKPATVHDDLPVTDGDYARGRHVWVYDLAQTDAGPGDRERSLTDYRIVVQVSEKYVGRGDPPAAWRADQKAWVESEVWAKLGAFNDESEFLLGSLWPETRSWDPIFDYDLMVRNGVFEAVVVLEYRELR